MASDILFIHPGNQKAIYQDLAREFTPLIPIWALLLAGALRRKGLDVAIHDAHIQGWTRTSRATRCGGTSRGSP